MVHGHGLIQERNINTGEMVEFEVSGAKIEAIYPIFFRFGLIEVPEKVKELLNGKKKDKNLRG